MSEFSVRAEKRLHEQHKRLGIEGPKMNTKISILKDPRPLSKGYELTAVFYRHNKVAGRFRLHFSQSELKALDKKIQRVIGNEKK